VTPNAVVYSSAISACARSQPPRPEKAMDLLRDAVEVKKIIMNVIGFNAAVSACAQAGDWENAITLLTRMENASSKNSTALQALIPAPDAVTYGTVFSACERGEQWELILKYAQSMQARNLELDGLAFTSCLHACQQLGLADKALDYLHMMKVVAAPSRQTFGWKRSGAKKPLQGPDDVAYRLAISACARGGAWEEGIRLLADFQTATGTPADVVAYTSAITGCEYAGEWKQAFLLLDKMRKEGVDANEVTMAAVIGACATACANQSKILKDGLMPVPQQKALRLLHVMKKDPSIVSPNIQVYNAAIRACAEAHDINRAFKLLEEIEEAEIERTEITYGSLMTACERVGRVESASKVFRKMKADDIASNEIIYGAAISCCRKAGESERALLLLRKMLQEGLSPNVATFNTVIVAQTEGRSKMDMERAVLVFKLMKSKYADENARPNRQTYSLLIRFFAANKQPQTAESFIQKMREDGFVPDVDLFTATVAGYERMGQPLKALQLMESMQEDGYDFYGVKVLNLAFAKAVKLVNRVGRGLSSTEDGGDDAQLKLNDADEEGDAFVKQTHF
jgi:pentatricopeptide repeat domain-containing protein 1